MERASKLIRGRAFAGESVSPETLVAAVWLDAVGRKVAAHTRVAKMVRTRLVVEVEDRVWQRQLFALTPHILKNLARSLGSGLVEDVEFRVVPRKLEPQRAMQPVPAAAPDEADGIADPVLRGLYRVSRIKAGA
jgi:predicted nucleic acid-binding Zn ribbon protein